jgi:aminoglycoside phosphotransferase (APT) family kinase protein
MAEWSPEQLVDEPLARRLIGSQFPQLAGAAIEPLGEGWDSTVWLVDGLWSFRFPRREVVVPGLEREIAVLPLLAPLLPAPIPVPELVGRPADGYPFPFAGARYLPGGEPFQASPGDAERIALAAPIACFLRALHSIDPGAHPSTANLPLDGNRRADMPYRVEFTRRRFDELSELGLWEAPSTVRELVESAVGLGAPAEPRIVHGDLHLRHVLIDGGRLSGVIDWIDVGLADPAVDLALYWGFVPPAGRPAFRDAYGQIGPDQLLRARVLAIFLWSTIAIYGRREGIPALELEAMSGLERAVTDELS